MAHIDPAQFELPQSTIIKKVTDDMLAIVIIRKSRIIMKDGERLLDYAGKIQKVMPYSGVMIKTTAPVCSKTEEFLAENGIRVEKMEMM